MIAKKEFAGFMARLAIAIPRYAPALTDELLDVWFGELSRLYPEDLATIYKRAVSNFDAFPSMRQMLELVGKADQDPEAKGREVADRIWTCLTRGWASSLAPAVKAQRDEFVGPIGSEVVRLQGGWQRLAEVCQDDEETTRKAQWRETARNIAQKGGLGQAPQLPELISVADRLKLNGKIVDLGGD